MSGVLMTRVTTPRSSLRQHVVVLTCLLLVGCGARRRRVEPKRVPVAGIVSVDGKPLESGIIYFNVPSLGLIDIGQIVQGRFTAKAIPGRCRVELSVPERTTTPQLGLPDFEGMRDKLPPHLNNDSTLVAGVTAEGPNEFSFDVSTSARNR